MNMPSASSRLAFHLCLALVTIRGGFAQPLTGAIEFEVASVKPSEPGARTPNIVLGAGKSLTISNVPLRGIITYAYDIRDFQLTSAPGWTNEDRFDVVAKTAATDRTNAGPAPDTDEQRRYRVARVRERLRSLLSDRFGLRAHIEQREHTVLALRVAKGGPKFTAATPKAESDSGRLSFVTGRIQGFGVPISMLATQLSNSTGLIVQDETSLDSKYDFLLEWAPDDKDQSDTRPSIYAALVDQLGLRLEQTKGLVKTVVIDHVERPSAN